MTREEIRTKVFAIVRKSTDYEESQLEESLHFSKDLSMDSLERVEMVMALEEEFKMSVPDEDQERIKTVGDAISYIEERLKKKASG